MSIIERLEDKVARQMQKVEREQERLADYQEQLSTAMYATFLKRQQQAHLSFEEALEAAFGREQPTKLDYPINELEE